MPSPKSKYFYTTIADSFDRMMNPYDVARRLEVVFDELLKEDIKGKLVLDAGAGTGYFSQRARDLDARVISLDLGVSLLKKVGQRCESLLAVGDVTQLPFAAASFDVIVSSEVIEHTTDPRQAVAELGRVLKPGGVLVLTCPNKVWQWLVTLASRTGMRPFDGIENFPSYASLETFVCDAGLRLTDHVGFHPWPFQLKPLWSLSRKVDKQLGSGAAGRWMINQGIRAVKGPGT